MKHRTIRKIRLITLLALIIIGTIITVLMLREEECPIFVKGIANIDISSNMHYIFKRSISRISNINKRKT